MIPRRIAAAFPADVRSRGERYFSSRNVRISRSGPVALKALVSGTTGYVVELRAESGLLAVSCTCPYAADHGICKHIWATLRHASAEHRLDRLLSTTGPNPALSALIHHDEARELNGANGARRPGASPEWRTFLDAARRQMTHLPLLDEAATATWPEDQRIVYIVDLSVTWHTGGLLIELATERRRDDGTWEPPGPFRIGVDAWQSVPDALDRQIAQMLIGAAPPDPYGAVVRTSGFVLRGPALDTTLRFICATGRCRVRTVTGERPVDAVSFDEGDAWQFRLRVSDKDEDGRVVTALLRRGNQEMPLDEPTILHSEGLLLARGSFARFDYGGAFALVSLFRERPSIRVPESDLPAMLESLYTLPRRPALELPPDAHITEVRAEPQSGVVILPDPDPSRQAYHRLEPFFVYDTLRVNANTLEASIFDRETLTVHHRDLAREHTARARLLALGAREEWNAGGTPTLSIHANKLNRLIIGLVEGGWRVEADGALYRAAGEARATVTSGIDWFELDAGVRYGNITVSLHDLLAARRRGATTIELSDGSHGIIPTEWLARLGPHRRRRHARGRVAALYAFANSAARRAARHASRGRRRRRRSTRRAPRCAASTGSRRPIRRDHSAERCASISAKDSAGFTSCERSGSAAAWPTTWVWARPCRCSRCSTRVAARRTQPTRPSIVVVPRSLVFNWMREAERFTPQLRVLDYSGVGRSIDAIDSASVDLVITTYGTLRRDVAQLAEIDLRLRDPRRGPGDQDAQLGVGQGSPPPARRPRWR